ncbi:MAG: CocE/NonD family hydrolase [Acidobacteriota bacterium]
MRAFPVASALLFLAAPALLGMRAEEVYIPMPDGVRLAATLYHPDAAAIGQRFPAILEYLPYRKDDGTLSDDLERYPYVVERGYVGARVDIRGTGRSEGHAPDREYSEQEQQDAMEVIAWLARQPWCNGNVGMWGISWGGFNSLQIAARRPPQLKAIVPAMATEDLFQDDIHYIDGLFHVDEYELAMEIQPSITRSPDYPLDEARLAERFDNPPWSLLYKKQQRDGPFWRRASLNPERYGAIQVPTLLIAGWFDGYRDSVPRLLEKMQAPVRAIVGPWNHNWPHEGVPGPNIEWREVVVRFFDRYLKGMDTGIEKEPRLAVYVRHWHPPDPNLTTVPGEWRYEEGWPIRRARATMLYMAPDRTLSAAEAAPGAHALAYTPSSGESAGFWWGELLPDQRSADAWSLVYDSEPLPEDMEILGFPTASLRASADAPLANWFARLSDVAPDGSVTLVTGAGLSGAQRESSVHPTPLEPGRPYPLTVEMHFTSWVFPKGHRIRVAVSNALWPMIWPTPYAMTTTLHLGGADGSRLVLPVIPPEARPHPSFSPPAPAPEVAGVSSEGDTWPGAWSICRDPVRQTAHGDWSGTSKSEFSWGTVTDAVRLSYDVSDAHPEAASIQGEGTTTIALPGRVLVWKADLEVRSDQANFSYRLKRELSKDGVSVREKSWQETIPRDLQ